MERIKIPVHIRRVHTGRFSQHSARARLGRRNGRGLKISGLIWLQTWLWLNTELLISVVFPGVNSVFPQSGMERVEIPKSSCDQLLVLSMGHLISVPDTGRLAQC